jgi:hypothetical protein
MYRAGRMPAPSPMKTRRRTASAVGDTDRSRAFNPTSELGRAHKRKPTVTTAPHRKAGPMIKAQDNASLAKEAGDGTWRGGGAEASRRHSRR